MTAAIGSNVRAIRLARGLNQPQLGKAVGITKSHVSHIEAGRRDLKGDLLERVAYHLGVETERLTAHHSPRVGDVVLIAGMRAMLCEAKGYGARWHFSDGSTCAVEHASATALLLAASDVSG